jgi:hypothetical protein
VIDLQADIEAIFYGPDFAAAFMRRRVGVADLPLRLILGTADVDVLDARATAASRKATFPASKDVRLHDQLVAVEAVAGYPAGAVFTLLERPERVNDGLEMEVYLSLEPTP